jgi:hypothetical protein
MQVLLAKAVTVDSVLAWVFPANVAYRNPTVAARRVKNVKNMVEKKFQQFPPPVKESA